MPGQQTGGIGYPQNPQFATAQYATTTNSNTINYIDMQGVVQWTDGSGALSYQMEQKKGIAPQLYFKYIKKKFGMLQGMKLKARLDRLEKAFNKAIENGQEALGMKLMTDLAREAKESALYAVGIKHFIEYDDITKYKRQIRGGHISDTRLQDYTRVIPDDVLKKKKAVEHLFDGFVIYHYWDEAAEKARAGKQKMSEEEKGRMRDPVLFGIIRESNRLYFIADWEDEYCDLTFEEMIDVIGKDDHEHTIPREPKL